MKVFLLSAWPARQANDWHWGNLQAFKTSAMVAKSDHTIVDNPRHADIILFADCGPLPLGLSLLLNQIWWRFNSKCFVYDEQFNPNVWYRGLIVSAEQNRYNKILHRGAAYIRVGIATWAEQLDFPERPKFLFSFCGAFETHPVRKALNCLSKFGFILDVPRSITQTAFEQGDSKAIDDLHSQLESISRDSLFVLCPRGVATSSMRLYEVMSMGRAPVIISDAWVPPYGAHWDSFSVRVPENQVDQIPLILSKLRPKAEAMGREARKAWETWYAPNKHFNTSVLACIDIIENNGSCAFSWLSLMSTFFSRRGLRQVLRLFHSCLSSIFK